MARAQSSQRRRRTGDELDDEDSELHASTPKRKRLRVEDDLDEDGTSAGDDGQMEDGPTVGSQSPAGSLLPDSFRRSPRAARPPGQHQPGSIVRVRLKDFVTYTNAEFNPGPNLNMVIGPNGTGKSTLVCAICIGLGWEPSHLGRQKHSGDFVKNGMDKAEIEIELAADPERHDSNPVIKTKLTRQGNKVDYVVNGKKSAKKAVLELMKSFSIQIDNLCQFLPQDRVVEFARLSPVELLAQTQRAAAPPQMSEWHDQLKEMRKTQKQKTNEQQFVLDELKNKEDRQGRERGDVERLLERKDWQARVAALEKLRPFPQYRLAQKNFKEAKASHKEAEKDLRRLERQIEPNLQAERAKEAYLRRIEAVVPKRAGLVEKTETEASRIKGTIEAADEAIKELDTELEAEKKVAQAARQNMPKLNRDKTAIEKAMQNPPAETDFAAFNERIRDMTRETRELDDKREEIRQEIGSLSQHIRQREEVVERAEAEKASMNTQAGQLANKLRGVSRDAHRAWEWIQAHQDRFQSEIYGPPIVSCSVKDLRNARAVESALGGGEMIAFTATSLEDYRALQNALYDELKLDRINIRQSTTPLANFRPPMSPEQMGSMGLDGWILDLVDGPEPVLAMLCDNRNIHATAFAGRELSNASLDALKGPRSPITSWITPTETYR
ncbi:Structural maintenance of chromosomes protein 5, partial [Teratosphaeriaceae sp. CCFEE 6253]